MSPKSNRPSTHHAAVDRRRRLLRTAQQQTPCHIEIDRHLRAARSRQNNGASLCGGGGRRGDDQQPQHVVTSEVAARLTDLGSDALAAGNARAAVSLLRDALRRVDDTEATSPVVGVVATPDGRSSGEHFGEYDEGLRSFPTANAPPSILLPALSSTTTTAATVLYTLGRAHLELGEMEPSIECFGRSLSELRRSGRDYYDAGDGLGRSTSFGRDSLEFSMALMHNLAYATYRLGRLDESLSCYRRALDEARAFVALQVQPEEYDRARIAVASSLNCVAVLLFHIDHAKHDAECTALLVECLRTRESVIGTAALATDRDAATALNNLGRVHYMLGRYPQALEAYIEALAARRALLGPAHLDVAATVYNTGQTLHRLGRNDDAMDLYSTFLEVARPVLGTHHRDVAIMLKCMASVHHERGSHGEALRLYAEALDAARSSLGPCHPEVASTLNKLGNLLYEKGRHDDAMRVYGEGLAAERAALEPDHPNISVTLTNMAQIHRVKGESARALRLYDEVLRLQRSRYGGEAATDTTAANAHPDVALTLSSIALIHYQAGRYDDALDYYQDSLRVYGHVHGPGVDHADVAGALNSIGLVLFKRGLLPVAMESFRECLRMRRSLLGDVHRDVAVVLYNMATVRLEGGDEEEAMMDYDEALRVEREALGRDHPDVATTLTHIGQVYQDRGMLGRATDYFAEALRLEVKASGPHHVSVARTLNHLGNLKLQTNDAAGAVEAYAEALRIYRRNGVGEDRLVIAGMRLYEMAIVHPECAAVA